MRVKINVSQEAKVQLTEHGIEVLKDYIEFRESLLTQMGSSVSLEWLREGLKGYLEVPLWELMLIFGDYHTMGAPPCFKDNNIKFIL